MSPQLTPLLHIVINRVTTATTTTTTALRTVRLMAPIIPLFSSVILSLIASAMLASPALAVKTKDTPVLGIWHLAMEHLPAEDITLPEQSKAVLSPKAPGPMGAESEWAEFRRSYARYLASKDEWVTRKKQRNQLERGIRAATKQRLTLERLLAATTGKIELLLKRLPGFTIQGHQQITQYQKQNHVQQSTQQSTPLVQCTTALCAAKQLQYLDYLVIVLQRTDVPKMSLLLFAHHNGALALLSERQMATRDNPRDPLFKMLQIAQKIELKKQREKADKFALALQWKQAQSTAQNALRYAPNDAGTLFRAAEGAFHQGALTQAAKYLSLIVDRIPSKRKRRVQRRLSQAFDGQAAYLLGLIALRKGAEKIAAKRFHQAISSGFDSFEARLFLGRAGITTAPKASLKHLKKAVEMRPASGEANFLLGEFLLSRRSASLSSDDNLAVDYLSRAIAADFNTGRAHYLLGLLPFKQRQSDALLHLEAAQELQVSDRYSLQAMGNIYLAQGELDSAYRVLLRARRWQENSPKEELQLCKLALQTHHQEAATKLLTAFLSRLQENAMQGAGAANKGFRQEVNRLLAHIYLQAEAHPLAARYFSQALKLGADSIQARVSIARNASLMGDDSRALLHLRQAEAQLASREKSTGQSSDTELLSAELYGRLAFVLLETTTVSNVLTSNSASQSDNKSHDQRLAADEEITRLLVRAVAGGYQVAEISTLLATQEGERDKPNHKTVIKWLAKAAQAGSKSMTVLRPLAQDADSQCRLRGKACQEARQYWTRLLDVVPQDSEASFSLGRLLAPSENHTEARAYLLHTVDDDLYRVESHRLLGELAGRLEDHKQMVFHYTQSLQTGEPTFEVLAALGAEYSKLRQRHKAIRYWMRALAFRPRSAIVNLAIAKLLINSKQDHDINRARPFITNVEDSKKFMDEVYFLRGQLALQNGDLKKAQDFLEQAIITKPNGGKRSANVLMLTKVRELLSDSKAFTSLQ